MKITPEQIRALTEEYYAGVGGERMRHDVSDGLVAAMAAAFGKVFPETKPPEGSVKVQYAIVLGNEGCSSYWPVNEAKDAADAIREAEACNPDDRITHRGIVEAWLPPVQSVPVVQGTSIPAEVEVRDA